MLIEDQTVDTSFEKTIRYGFNSEPRVHSPPKALISGSILDNTPGLSEVIDAIATASCEIADLVATSRVKNYHSRVGDTNFTGDDQTHLDVLSNKIMIDCLRGTGKVAMMVSEEDDLPIDGQPGADLVVVFDPLDGSSNIECGLSVGTLFGIFKSTGTNDVAEVLQEGNSMLAAGYALYGASTTLVIATSLTEPVRSFSRDPCTGAFVEAGVMVMPTQPKKILSVNAGNFSKWDPELADIVQDAISGPNPFAFRYVGSFVADLHRTLLYGGLFMYPADTKNTKGKLRMLYECFPAAFVTEAAGGGAHTGKGYTRLLDSKPTSPHEKCPIFIGSAQFVDDLAEMIGQGVDMDTTTTTTSTTTTPTHNGQPMRRITPAFSVAIVLKTCTENSDSGEISAQKGEFLLVDQTELSDKDWLLARHLESSKKGIIRRDCVALAPQGSQGSSQCGYGTAVALKNWEGEDEAGEYSVKKGDVLLVSPDALSDKNWIRVHSLDMSEGGVIPVHCVILRPALCARSETRDNTFTAMVCVEDTEGFTHSGDHMYIQRGDIAWMVDSHGLADTKWVMVKQNDDCFVVPKSCLASVQVPLAVTSSSGFGTAVLAVTYDTDEVYIPEGTVVLLDPAPISDPEWIRIRSLDSSICETTVIPRSVLAVMVPTQKMSEILCDLSFLNSVRDVRLNLNSESLRAISLDRGEGFPSLDGALVTRTGERTGRSANDRFIVDTAENVNWGPENRKISSKAYWRLRAEVVAHLTGQNTLFVQDVVCGHDPVEALPVRIITDSAWHAMFTNTMFLSDFEQDLSVNENDTFTILHAPTYTTTRDLSELNSGTFVIINFDAKEVLIAGTEYAGEIKKSIFSVMNLRLPREGILPLHSAANIGNDGGSALFFGLSGTGKTTLSADPNRALIGDDEIAWSHDGVFNLEDGCYAKLINITETSEPEIFGYCKNEATILENVVVDEETMVPEYQYDPETALTANTRAAYPLSLVHNLAEGARGGHPKHIILLTCDASGVLPPVARLSQSQAAYYFMSGYTTKTPGTEVGVNEPIPTFSACFGEAFMPLHPGQYASLLMSKMKKHGTTAWLLNTGWIEGPYGTGKRISLKHTRAMLSAILEGKLDNVFMKADPRFGFEIPTSCPEVPGSILFPVKSWPSRDAYVAAANKLVDEFKSNFQKYTNRVSPDVLAAQPRNMEEHEQLYYDYDHKPISEAYLNYFLARPQNGYSYRDYQKARIEQGPEY